MTSARVALVFVVLGSALQLSAQIPVRHPDLVGTGNATLVSGSGDVIGEGQSWELTATMGEWRAIAVTTENAVTLANGPLRNVILTFEANEESKDEAGPTHQWYWTLNSTEAQGTLTVGTYVDDNGIVTPILGVTGIISNGCPSDVLGEFQITAIEFGCRVGPGFYSLKSFAAQTTTYCGEKTEANKLTTTITYTNSNACASGGRPADVTPGTPGGTPGGPTTPPPPPPPFQVVFPTDFDVTPLTLTNSGEETLTFKTAVDSDFDSDLRLSVVTDAQEWEDFHATITPEFIARPGTGESQLKISTGPNTFPRTYRVTIIATDDREVFSRTILVTVNCEPPFILGVNQPQHATVSAGHDVALEVVPHGSGPFSYQWYRGFRGMTREPIPGEHFAKLDFAAMQSGTYWVRVSNACGTVDSNAATVTTTGTAPARRRGGN